MEISDTNPCSALSFQTWSFGSCSVFLSRHICRATVTPASREQGHGGLSGIAGPRFAADPEDERNWGPEIFVVARDVGELGPAGCGLSVTFLLGWEGKQSWEDAALASPETAASAVVVPRRNIEVAQPSETSTSVASEFASAATLSRADLDGDGRAGS